MFRSRRSQMFFKIIKVCKFHRKAPVLESSLIKLQALRTATFSKRDSNTGFLLWILWIIQKHLFCVEDLWTAGSETPVRLFKNTFFYRASPVAASDSLRFPACSFIKKGTPAKKFFCHFCTIFKNIFLQNTSRWLLLVCTCNFEKSHITYFIEHLWKTAHFMYKLQNFNHQIQ